MKLIQNIITELVDSDKGLSGPLLKTKVLAAKLGNHDLLEWVNLELTGYNDLEKIPSYRQTPSNLIGSCRNGHDIVNNQPLMTTALPKEIELSMRMAKLDMSVATMESLIENGSSGTLKIPLPAEICLLLTEGYNDMGYNYFEVLSARYVFGKNALVQALSEIRSKLLDLMLSIDIEYGNIDFNQLIEQDKDKINNTLINNIHNNIISGNNNLINDGNNNHLNKSD